MPDYEGSGLRVWNARNTGSDNIVDRALCHIDDGDDGSSGWDSTDFTLCLKAAAGGHHLGTFINVSGSTITQWDYFSAVCVDGNPFYAPVNQSNPEPGEVYGMCDGSDDFVRGTPGFLCLAKIATDKALLLPHSGPYLFEAQADGTNDGPDDTIVGKWLDSDGNPQGDDAEFHYFT